MSFWDIIWFIIVSFAFIAYLMILFNIIGDLFRDRSVSGHEGGLDHLPDLHALPSSIVYLIARGPGCTSVCRRGAEGAASQEEYIRSVAAATPADQIAQAKGLLDSGAISQAEFDALKAKALA